MKSVKESNSIILKEDTWKEKDLIKATRHFQHEKQFILFANESKWLKFPQTKLKKKPFK